MKICAAQTKPIKGDIRANIDNHKKLIMQAVEKRADMIVFPELSITGYEPELARELATGLDDKRLDGFQVISDSHDIIICVGVPLKSDDGITIGMVIFQPDTHRQPYSKMHLHTDEFPFFVCGKGNKTLLDRYKNIAFAICYEVFVEEHTRNAFEAGATIYIASVAKSAAGVVRAITTMGENAKRYSMVILMANCVGHCDNFDCGGKSSVWNDKGELKGQLSADKEGLLFYDTTAC